MATNTPNYNLSVPENTDTMEDTVQAYRNNLEIIDNNLGGGGGGGGHTIVDENGSDMPAESKLQFTGNVSVTDDNVNGATVVDIKGNGLILDAQIYSDTEKVIGVWRDKKPLYQKTVNIAPIVSDASWHDIPHGISNIDNIVNVYGITTSQSAEYNPIPQMRNTTTSGITLHVTTTNIRYNCNWFSGGNFAYVTIQYTKTTDTAGSGGFEAYGFSPVIYSDVERVVGVWRDNKPLYQKTVDCGLVTADSNWHSIAHGVSDMDDCVGMEAICIKQDVTDIVNGYRPALNLGIALERNGANLQYMNTWFGTGDRRLIVTLRYTKTTDVAGSGDYNTYGVPTVHYSTSEQVIGTWITGKPLYEQTISFGSLPNNAIKTVAHGIANVDMIFVSDSFFVTPSGASSYLNFTNDSTSGQTEILVDKTNVEIWAGNNRTSWDGYVTVRYTKTTD